MAGTSVAMLGHEVEVARGFAGLSRYGIAKTFLLWALSEEEASFYAPYNPPVVLTSIYILCSVRVRARTRVCLRFQHRAQPRFLEVA